MRLTNRGQWLLACLSPFVIALPWAFAEAVAR